MPQVLLLHGFTSHPVKVWGPLPDRLERAGFEVHAPALRGHGGKPEDLSGVRAEDWLDDVHRAAANLEPGYAVVGLSMGGLLAAYLAASDDPAAMVALVPALGFQNPLAPLAPFLSRVIKKLPGTDSVSDPELRRNNPNYPYFPTAAFVELLKLSRQAPGWLPRVRAPSLVIQAEYDRVIPKAAVRRYHDLLGGPKSYWLAPASGHDALLDRNAELVAGRIVDWLRETVA
ncbi:alpha/beta hydrolase [Oceanithermus sp.]